MRPSWSPTSSPPEPLALPRAFWLVTSLLTLAVILTGSLTASPLHRVQETGGGNIVASSSTSSR